MDFYGLVTGTCARRRLRLSYAAVLCVRCRSFSHPVHRFRPPTRSPRPKWPVPTCGISGIRVRIPDPRSRQNAGDPASRTNRTRPISISDWLQRKYRCTSRRSGGRELRRWIPRNRWRPSRVVLQISMERESFSTCSIEIASSPSVFFFFLVFNFLGVNLKFTRASRVRLISLFFRGGGSLWYPELKFRRDFVNHRHRISQFLCV